MRKTIIILVVILTGLSTGCNARTGNRGASAVTQPAVPPNVPEVTATPTSTRDGSAGATAVAPGNGHYIEFTHQVSSGLATIHAAAHSCGGIRGPWEGSFDIEMDAGKMTIQGTGPFNFSIQSDGLSIHGEAPFSGAGTVSSANCIILDVSDPLQFEISLKTDKLAMEVLMGSIGGGTLTAQCGKDPPVTIPFAISWGPEPLLVPIYPYAGCS